MELPCEPASPLLSVCPGELRAYVRANTWTQMFIATLFIIAKKGGKTTQTSSSEVDKYNVYPYSGKLFIHKKE